MAEVRSAIESLVRVQAWPRAALLAELARFDVALVVETLDAMLQEGRVRRGPGGRLTARSRR